MGKGLPASNIRKVTKPLQRARPLQGEKEPSEGGEQGRGQHFGRLRGALGQ